MFEEGKSEDTQTAAVCCFNHDFIELLCCGEGPECDLLVLVNAVVVVGTTRDRCRRQVTGKGRDGVAREEDFKRRETAGSGTQMP